MGFPPSLVLGTFFRKKGGPLRRSVPPVLFFEQRIRHPLRGHFLTGPSLLGALDERQLVIEEF
jgi:hypothetical protein